MCATFLDDFVYKKDTFQETRFLKKTFLKIMFIGELKVKT